jgi:hypothetical protein
MNFPCPLLRKPVYTEEAGRSNQIPAIAAGSVGCAVPRMLPRSGRRVCYQGRARSITAKSASKSAFRPSADAGSSLVPDRVRAGEPALASRHGGSGRRATPDVRFTLPRQVCPIAVRSSIRALQPQVQQHDEHRRLSATSGVSTAEQTAYAGGPCSAVEWSGCLLCERPGRTPAPAAGMEFLPARLPPTRLAGLSCQLDFRGFSRTRRLPGTQPTRGGTMSARRR